MSGSRRSHKSKQLAEMRDTDAALASELLEKLNTGGDDDPAAAKEEARRRRKEKYATKHNKEADPVVQISEEQRLRAMLGYGWDEGGDKPAHLVMEYICACCGTEHKAPHLLDAYYLCHSCQNVLREPAVLRKRWSKIEPECKLEICYATYGDFFEPTLAYVVTPILQARVDEIYYRDRLHMRKTADLAAWFAPLAPPQWASGDPCPGSNKQLKIRYRMLGLHGMLNLDVNPDNHLSSNFMMMAPTVRYLAILHASYGHPKGQSPQGRMSVEVTEVVQGMVDMVGGSYLTISYMASAKRMFGDPCPGYPKDLRIKFDIAGRSGEVLCDEMRGFLRQRCQIEYAPTIQPLIFCRAATFGISPSGRKMRLDQVVLLLRRISAVEHRQANGSSATAAEKKLLAQKHELVQERHDLQTAVTSFIDVREKVQRMCDKAGRCFELNKGRPLLFTSLTFLLPQLLQFTTHQTPLTKHTTPLTIHNPLPPSLHRPHRPQPNVLQPHQRPYQNP